MTLDEAIKLEKSLIGEGKTYDCIADQMHTWLSELNDLRESSLRPAAKYVKINTLCEQMKHLTSEFKEVEHEYWHFDKDHEPLLREELVDLQMSAETMLAILGLNEQQRREARKKVIAKNAARGYYE